VLPTVEPLGAGLDHSAYLLNDDLVVRFRRDPAEAWRLAAEGRLLEFVRRISPVPVPRPVFADARRGCMAYPRLRGVPLISLGTAGPKRDVGAGSAGGRRDVGLGTARAWRDVGAGPVGVGARLGELLAVLHAVPPDQVAGFAEVDDAPPAEWQEEAAQLWPSVSAHVPRPHRPAVEAFLGERAPAPASTLVFSHQDLGIEHVLVDPGTGTVSGVIDWSDAAIGDPARDYGLILRDLGPGALAAALPHRDLLPRIEFYARCGLIADLAHGITTGRHEYATKSLTALSWLFPP
jgi:Phosphotransferase enzyme family